LKESVDRTSIEPSCRRIYSEMIKSQSSFSSRIDVQGKMSISLSISCRKLHYYMRRFVVLYRWNSASGSVYRCGCQYH